jgi:hypothetical protein
MLAKLRPICAPCNNRKRDACTSAIPAEVRHGAVRACVRVFISGDYGDRVCIRSNRISSVVTANRPARGILRSWTRAAMYRRCSEVTCGSLYGVLKVHRTPCELVSRMCPADATIPRLQRLQDPNAQRLTRVLQQWIPRRPLMEINGCRESKR